MKLIRAYVENFGGLASFALEFSDGLTVIDEPNGFGKTTLAEFIRAMFYGFPRKGRALEKSPRQKYAPWQGGSFGGNLVFEHDGARYRVERTFGTVPKNDTFTLIDLKTGKRSRRFSENLGQELFGLDGESFERSTYMPQLQEKGSLTTSGIQAKLGNLVEDTSDVGNFDRALDALKKTRSGYIPYRGSGGSVAKAREQVSRLQEDLAEFSAQQAALEAADREITHLEKELEARRGEQRELRSRIHCSSEAAGAEAARREYGRMTDQRNRLQAEMDGISVRWGGSMPAEERVEEARIAAEEAASLARETVVTDEDRAAARWAAENRIRFEGRVPKQESLDACREQIRLHRELKLQAKNAALSREERAQLEQLTVLQAEGRLEEHHLDELEKSVEKLAAVRQQLQMTGVPDDGRVETLRSYFSSGIPEDEQIAECRRKLTDADEMYRKAAAVIAVLQDHPGKRVGVLQILLWILGAAGFCVGAALLLNRMILWGGVGLGAGVLALTAAAVLHGIRKKQPRERLAVQELETQARTLEESAAEFIRSYTARMPLAEGLREIEDNRETLLALASRQEELTQKRIGLEAEIMQLEESLTRALGTEHYRRELTTLRMAAEHYVRLSRKEKEAGENIRKLNGEMESREREIAAFLGMYFEETDPDSCFDQLEELRRDSERYERCRKQAEDAVRRSRIHKKKLEALEDHIGAFYRETGIIREADAAAQLLCLRDDSRDYRRMSGELALLSEEIRVFEDSHRLELELQLPEKREDVAHLQRQEREVSGQIEALTGMVADRNQRRNRIVQTLSRMASVSTELQWWQDRLTQHRKKAELLDATLMYLQQARENLQTSYLEPIRSHFARYMARLTGEAAEHILLSPELEVQLERQGRARQLGYFSAGQTDLVLLCMRFALVDALFTRESPVIILDDPFVNLDDSHMEEALKLLRELAKEKQILYMTCSDSRTPK